MHSAKRPAAMHRPRIRLALGVIRTALSFPVCFRAILGDTGPAHASLITALNELTAIQRLHRPGQHAQRVEHSRDAQLQNALGPRTHTDCSFLSCLYAAILGDTAPAHAGLFTVPKWFSAHNNFTDLDSMHSAKSCRSSCRPSCPSVISWVIQDLHASLFIVLM